MYSADNIIIYKNRIPTADNRLLSVDYKISSDENSERIKIWIKGIRRWNIVYGKMF
jgi:hypothetical protein